MSVYFVEYKNLCRGQQKGTRDFTRKIFLSLIGKNFPKPERKENIDHKGF